jgi:hypothetical protein
MTDEQPRQPQVACIVSAIKRTPGNQLPAAACVKATTCLWLHVDTTAAYKQHKKKQTIWHAYRCTAGVVSLTSLSFSSLLSHTTKGPCSTAGRWERAAAAAGAAGTAAAAARGCCFRGFSAPSVRGLKHSGHLQQQQKQECQTQHMLQDGVQARSSVKWSAAHVELASNVNGCLLAALAVPLLMSPL